MNVENEYKDLYWPFGQHMLTGMNIIKEHKNFYPIYITNHGCGPDTAIQHFIKTELDGRNYLHLEVDEHGSKVGIITRLEAFLYSITPQPNTNVKVKKEVTPTKTLLPDFGEYSRLIPTSFPVEKVNPLKRHKSFNYAINKEYHTMLVMLEEILSTIQKGVAYELPFPIDEGSEVFGQYGLLIYQELIRLGYDVNYKPFFLEDLIKKDNYKEIFINILKADLVNSLNDDEKENARKIDDLDELANYVRNSLNADLRQKAIAVGEPLCIYKDSIFIPNTKHLNTLRIMKMPLFEAMLMHNIDIDRKNNYKARINELLKIHNEMCRLFNDFDLFTPISKLQENSKNRLDFCIGDFARYGFSKLLSLKKSKTYGAIILNSSDENVSIILKILLNAYKNEINVPICNADIDFSHSLSFDDSQMFLNMLD